MRYVPKPASADGSALPAVVARHKRRNAHVSARPHPPPLRVLSPLGCSKQEIRALKKQRLKELERKRKAKAKAKDSETPEEKIARRLAKKVGPTTPSLCGVLSSAGVA